MRIAPAAYRPPSIGERARDAVRSEGILPFARHATRWLVQYAAGVPGSVLGTSRTFAVGGTSYEYLVHRYHYTWLNERAVEVPIIRAALAGVGDGRVLEVGNVLGHYESAGHAVLDRYERAPGVINADVLEFEDEDGFELIVSISTLEHVGWDERPRDHDAAERAFAHLVQLLSPGGTLVLTVPVGYNPHLDEAIRGGRLGLSELRALRREERRNIWREVDPAEVWDAPYDSLLCTAHGIVVCHAHRAAVDSVLGARRCDRTWPDRAGGNVSPAGPGAAGPAEEQHARPRGDRNQGHLGVVAEPLETVAQNRGDRGHDRRRDQD